MAPAPERGQKNPKESSASHGDFVQADVLDRGPDDRETTGLRREDVNLS